MNRYQPDVLWHAPALATSRYGSTTTQLFAQLRKCHWIREKTVLDGTPSSYYEQRGGKRVI